MGPREELLRELARTDRRFRALREGLKRLLGGVSVTYEPKRTDPGGPFFVVVDGQPRGTLDEAELWLAEQERLAARRSPKF